MFALLSFVCFLIVLILHVVGDVSADILVFDLGLVLLAASFAFGQWLTVPWQRG